MPPATVRILPRPSCLHFNRLDGLLCFARGDWLDKNARACQFGTAGKPLEETAPGSAPGWWIAQKSTTTHHAQPDPHELMVEQPSLVLACGSAATSVPRKLVLSL